jgi:adenylate kinase
MKFNLDFNNIERKTDINSDPQLLIIVGAVKSGKSTILNDLSKNHNWLILDTQKISGYNNLTGGKVLRLIELEPPMSKDAINEYKNIKKAIDDENLKPTKDNKTIRLLTDKLSKVKYWETYDRRTNLKKNEVYLSDIIEYYNAVDDKNEFINECKYDGVIVDLVDIFDEINSWAEYSAARKWCANNPDFILDKTRISILDLPGIQGSRGWENLRDEIKSYISELVRIFGKVIVVCHLKDKYINEQDKLTNLKDLKQLDLRGKTASLLSSEADACGFMYKVKEKGILSFLSAKSTVSSRNMHLHEIEIEISERTPVGEIKTHWERIFPSYAK